MALFGKKREADTTKDAPPASGDGSPKYTVQGDKAARFFEHARTVHEATNHEYAMQLWLNGLRQDPTSMRGVEGFFAAAAAFLGEGGKSPSKETLRMFGGRGELERYLSALLNWGLHPTDAVYAARAADAAAALGLPEQTYWLGERAMGKVAQEKRPRKDLYLKLLDVFMSIGAYDKAVECGEAAVRVDPNDSKLAAEVRNLAAQATMTRGGYESTGEAGGFRRNIRDAERQRHLEEEERIVKTEETIDRLVRRAEEEYRARPDDLPALSNYAKRLTERGRPEDEQRAYRLLSDAYEKTGQFRFRQMAGDIKLRRHQRKLVGLKEQAEAAPADAAKRKEYEEHRSALTVIEIKEYKARVEAYPTDLGLKFELGRRYFEQGEYEDAIAMFQQSQEDAKLRVQSLHHLGLAFMKIGWVDEAVHTFRQVLESHRIPSDEVGMELRYGLLTALQSKAESGRDLEVAEEADRLASSIAVQQINFKDIRVRRDSLKKLIADLKRGDAA